MIRFAAGADRRTRAVFWTLLFAALALPWGTGAAVKIYLDAQGLPTYPLLPEPLDPGDLRHPQLHLLVEPATRAGAALAVYGRS